MPDTAIDIANLNFLVAEDHEFQRCEMVRMLHNLGATSITAAPDGRAALDLMRGALKPFDVIVSDLNMPGMDGMEFIRHLGEARAKVSLIIASVRTLKRRAPSKDVRIFLTMTE